jgi:hypothetical protein
MSVPNDATSKSISVVMLAGANRETAQRTLRHVAKQTIRDQIELVVVDLAPENLPALDTDGMPGVYLRKPEIEKWAVGKAAGIRASSCQIVAFVEDHCRPAPKWAEKVLSAFEGPWTGVGYAFVNGSPDSYRSRSALMADYAPWAHPVKGGECRHMPGNNMAYRKEFLDSLEPELERVIGVDFNVQEILLERGGKMYVEPEAIAAHQCYESTKELMAANFSYVRVLAATRVRNQGWGLGMRILAALAAPPAVPLLRLWRLMNMLRGRKGMWGRLAASLPVVLLTYVVCAVGESTGYLFGSGGAEERLLYYELNCYRA